MSEHVAPAPGVTSVIRTPALVTKYASTCPAASSSVDLSEAAASVAAAWVSVGALLAELLKTAAHTLPDLSAAAASDAAARANGEALLAGLMETEANLADLAAQSLLIEEAQQAARAKKIPRWRSKLLRQRKSRKPSDEKSSCGTARREMTKRFGVWDPHENPGRHPENRTLAPLRD